MNQADQGGSDRRAFFREAMGKTVKPLAEYLERRFHIVTDRPHLRPPGALDEEAFLQTCRRCGTCIEECPGNAIFALDDDAGEAAGTPAIDPERAPCLLCDGLKCTYACPNGALEAVSVPSRVRIGLAQVYGSVCRRANGEDCTTCVDRCPLGPIAIQFNGSRLPKVKSPGCVGCGVCQFHCPTTPKAISVQAR
jgi:MauM/NapG family ferredoxin protein